MRSLGRFLRAALDLLLRLGDALGARGPRWEWKKQVWRQSLDLRISAWENLERGVRASTRMCRECRTLVPRSASVCPSCGANMYGIPSGGFSRLVSLIFPGTTTVTVLLISVNVGMMLVMLAVWGMGPGGGIMSLLSPPGVAYYLFGDKRTEAIRYGHEFWRLVTANYLHGGLLHLLMNCYALTTLGPLIEETFGARKFFVIYTTCGVAAFAVSALFSSNPAVGASGALFGLMGFGIVYGRYRGGSAGRYISDYLMRWAVYGVVMLFLPGIDNFAHAGGFVAGATLGAIVPPGAPQTRAGEWGLRFAFAAALLVTIGSFAAMALTYGSHLEQLRQYGYI